MSKKAHDYHEKMFPGYVSDFLRTDPDYIEMFDNFAFDEVVNSNDLSNHDRFLAILATLLGSQAVDEFRAMIKAAINFGVTPVEIKEVVYQSTAYLGIGRTFPFLKATNEVLESLGYTLPLPLQSTTTPETRMEKGEEALVRIGGEKYKGFGQTSTIGAWLTGNCFGDYYTRNGLNDQMREMITLCFLLAQGGCEPQLKGHVANNLNVGNDKDYLIKIVMQVMPFIGYPRTLNAIACINEICE